MASTLIVGYDDSAGAQAALDYTIALAKELGDAVVIAFGYDPPGIRGEELGAVRAAVKELGEELTKPALEKAKKAGVDAQLELVNASPSDALLQLARANKARMIVVGTYGESPIKGAIVGSTPHKLLQVADCPVLAVPVR